LAGYHNRHFVRPDGPLDLTPNVQTISATMATNGFKLSNTYQVYKNSMHIFPAEYFCPMSYTGRIVITNNTYCIHHYASSWESPKVKAKMFIIRRILGPEMTERAIRLKRLLLKRET